MEEDKDPKKDFQKIYEHPDREDIIDKLIMNVPPKEINEWLRIKYKNSPKKFSIPEKTIKLFKDTYLDVYKALRADMQIAKNAAALTTDTDKELQLSVAGNSLYRAKMLELADKELDIHKMVAGMCINIEERTAIFYDQIMANPYNIDSRLERVLLEWFDRLGANLERLHKMKNGDNVQTINHNVSVQHIDNHINVFYEAIKEVLAEMDLETSLLFMEKFNTKLNKLKEVSNKPVLSTDEKLTEVKLLNDAISEKINEA